MNRVAVIFTQHEEDGPVNISGLLAILERIEPEVIFLEMPPEAFGDYFNGNRKNLESIAVSRYRENHPVDLIPVDLPTPEADFFMNIRNVEIAARTSPEYRQLVSRHNQHLTAYGFAYLNSEHCTDHFSERHEAIVAALEKLADHELAKHYDLWIRTNAARDRAMMKNIENHCRQASSIRAAFLVGAAHRRSIIELSRSEPGATSFNIHWDFAGFMEKERG